MMQGQHTSWDYQPRNDASRQYMRNHLDLNEVEAARRFPQAGLARVPDHALDGQRVLVTGGTGFLGRHLVRTLAEESDARPCGS